MTGWRVLAARVLGFFGIGVGSRRRADELDDEMATHLACLADEYERRGLTPDAARAAARRAFGGVSQVKDACRDERVLPRAEGAWRDLRHGARLLLRSPASALTSLLSLGIAIGAATAVLAVVDSLFLTPMAVDNPSRLVLVEPQLNGKSWILPNPIFEELRREQRSLAGLAAVSDVEYLRITPDSGPATFVRASLVSGTYFPLLGVTPALGRLLVPDDDVEGQASECAAVLGYDYWTQEYGADPAVLGRRIRANDATCTIVGVAPAAFAGHLAGYSPHLWLPLRPMTSRRDLGNHHGAFFRGVFGRLSDGVSLEATAGELTSTYQQLQSHHTPLPRGQSPIDTAALRITLTSGAHGLHTLRREFGQALQILLVMVAVVLAIAAVNVASVLLARGLARQPELALRRAIGASPARLVGHLAAEGTLIVGAGVLLGIAIAAIATPFLASQVRLDYQTIELHPVPSLRLAAILGGVAAALLAIVGGLPACRLVRANAQVPLTTRSVTDSASAQRTLRALVVVQLSLAVVLVAVAGLFAQTARSLAGVDPGFEPDRVTSLRIGGSNRMAAASEAETLKRAAMYKEIERRLEAIPGVEAVGQSWLGLFSGSDLWIPTRDAGSSERGPSVHVDYVTARYFDAVGLRFLRGRAFRDDDFAAGARPVVINDTMARTRFGGDAIGRQFSLDVPADSGGALHVVGVVADSKYNDLREAKTEPMIWLPLVAFGGISMQSVTIRTAAGHSESIVAAARQALAEVGPQLIVRQVTTLRAHVDRTLARERLLFSLSLGFGAIAVLLAALGLYGTLAQAMTRRRRELGVRLALGARPGRVVQMVVVNAAWMVLAALAIAVPAAWLGAGLLRAFLFGVEPTDPLTIAASALFVGLVALATAAIPARRAARIDPLEVLRAE